MYSRLLREIIEKKLFKGKAIIVIGARQVGKTTLCLDLLHRFGGEEGKSKIFNCDDPNDRDSLDNKGLDFLKKVIGGAKWVFIDEGQKVPSIGQTLKLIVDHFKADIQVIVTGSSSLNLLDSTQEALTGRKIVFTLYPLGLREIHPDRDFTAASKTLADLLIYGSYPEVVARQSYEEKMDVLRELTSSYLYKDILEFQKMRNPAVLTHLLKALSLQVGGEVSYTELSSLLSIDKKTIERYVDLLEKCQVVFRLAPYHGHKRRELSKLRKVYFFDVGVRNAVINNFNPPDSRNDLGALWENFMVAERMKFRAYMGERGDQYFWRTYDGSEVDLIEERDGGLFGYEFKWGSRTGRSRPPVKWLEYPRSSFSVITPRDIDGFVL